MSDAGTNSAVVASLVPLNATLPAAVGGGATLRVATDYPFGERAVITAEVPHGHNLALLVRIPGWAVGATVDGAAAANGTLHRLELKAGTTTTEVLLHMEVRVEKGWGVHAEMAGAPLVYGANGTGSGTPVPVPSTDPEDWDLQGGASVVGSHVAGAQDIRTGGPGGTAWLVNRHPLYGESHAVVGASASLEYVAGYTPPPHSPYEEGATVTLHLLDMVTRNDLSGPILSWGPLDNYSFDECDGGHSAARRSGLTPLRRVSGTRATRCPCRVPTPRPASRSPTRSRCSSRCGSSITSATRSSSCRT